MFVHHLPLCPVCQVPLVTSRGFPVRCKTCKSPSPYLRRPHPSLGLWMLLRRASGRHSSFSQLCSSWGLALEARSVLTGQQLPYRLRL